MYTYIYTHVYTPKNIYRRGGHAWSSNAPSWRGGTRAKIVSRLSSSTAERGTPSGIAMASFCPKSVRICTEPA